MSQHIELAVVLPEGGTLRLWEESGVFDRQVALYCSLQEAGIQISIVSYGGREEFDCKSRLPGMKILCNWMDLPRTFYTQRIHQVLAPQLMTAQLLRTSDAAVTNPALRIAWAWQIPLIYRLSYVASKLARPINANDLKHLQRLEGRELNALATACHVIAATHEIADDLIQKRPETGDKMTVIPNHVDTDQFRLTSRDKCYDLIYIGRFAKQKNLIALLEAVERIGLTIAMIGGPSGVEAGTTDDESQQLRERFGDLGGRIHWLGRINNEELPAYINSARAFVLCSLIEGNPRVIIEAMACGMPIIGTNVPGIQNVLQHEVTGYLCNTNADSIGAAFKTILAQPDLMRKMGDNAQSFAVENFSLQMLAQREYELLLDVARRQPVDGATGRIMQYLLRWRS